MLCEYPRIDHLTELSDLGKTRYDDRLTLEQRKLNAGEENQIESLKRNSEKTNG